MSEKQDIKLEMTRRKSQRDRILDILTKRRYVTNIDLQAVAFNHTMRISELRKKGHNIRAEYISPGVFRYFYDGETR